MNMRYLWRSLLSVFVLWFALCPTLCYATETATTSSAIEFTPYIAPVEQPGLFSVTPEEVLDGTLAVDAFLYSVSGGTYSSVIRSLSVSAFNPPVTQSTGTSLSNASYNSWNSSKDYYSLILNFSNATGAEIVTANCGFGMDFSGLYTKVSRAYVTYSGSVLNSTLNVSPSNISGISAILWNEDKTESEVVDITDDLTTNDNKFGFSSDFASVPFDIYHIEIQFRLASNAYSSIPNPSGTYRWENMVSFDIGFGDATVSMDIEDETKGLLNGIVEWLKSIRDGIVNVKDSIVQLPAKIWGVFEEGIKGLFIPTEEDISNMHDQWDELMRDRFGAIYESGDIVHQFAQSMETSAVMVADNGGVISMPSATINVAGVNFTFGGYEVDIVPEGFEWLVQSIKMIVNIVCTIMFINALKSKIEVLLR